jgi:hypothetical protein
MRERSTFTFPLSVTNTPTLLSLGVAPFAPTTSTSASTTASLTFSTFTPYAAFDDTIFAFPPAFVKSQLTPPYTSTPRFTSTLPA